MAFPTIPNTAATNGTTAGATVNVNLPATIASGNTLLLLFRSATLGTISVSAAAGAWTQLYQMSDVDANDQSALFWKKATGSEGATVAVTHTSSRYAALTWEIADAADPDVSPPECSTAARGENTSMDPGAVTPTGGAKDYLWIWMGSCDQEPTWPPSGAPATGYANVISASSGTAGGAASNCHAAAASKTANATSDDGGAWTISTTAAWCAVTVAVHPPAVAGKAAQPPLVRPDFRRSRRRFTISGV